MKITNKFNLPASVISALENDSYNPGDSDISCTSLILPQRIYQLRKRHYKELHEDASDMIYRLLGQNTHHILERVKTLNCIKEHRFYATICGVRVGGQIDLFEQTPQILSDFKVTSVWAVLNGLKPEHEQQLNLNAYLMSKNGVKVKKLQITNFLRDWSKHKAKEHGYPSCQVVVQTYPLWSKDKAKLWVEDRVKLYLHCKTLSDNELPPCTSEETWEKATTYRVVKEGRKSAIRVLDSQKKADEYIEKRKLDKKHSVEVRKGERIRCSDYCSVSAYCSAYMGF